jgi:hypothetical protein
MMLLMGGGDDRRVPSVVGCRARGVEVVMVMVESVLIGQN